MLKKLFKYDMKWIMKLLIPFLIITLITSVLNRVFLELKSVNFIFNILYFTTIVITNGLIINLVFNTIIRNIIRFKSQVYGDESYLIHTLPVKRSDVIISKILSSVVSLLIVLFAGMLCICIEYLTPDMIDLIKNFIEVISAQYDINKATLIILAIIYIVSMVTWVTEMIYTSIILGYRSNDKKVLKSFVYAVLIYVIIEFCNLVSIGLLAVFNKDVFNILNTNVMTTSVIKPLIILILTINIVYSVVFYITSIKFIDKKLNID